MTAHPDKGIRWTQYSQCGRLSYGLIALEAISNDRLLPRSILLRAKALEGELRAFSTDYKLTVDNLGNKK